jgi:hypothetical protein
LVSQLELVGVLVKLEDLENFGNNIEVPVVFVALLQFNNSISTDVGALEEVAGPLSQS